MKSCTEAPHTEDAQQLDEIYDDGMPSSFAWGNVARNSSESSCKGRKSDFDEGTNRKASLMVRKHDSLWKFLRIMSMNMLLVIVNWIAYPFSHFPSDITKMFLDLYFFPPRQSWQVLVMTQVPSEWPWGLNTFGSADETTTRGAFQLRFTGQLCLMLSQYCEYLQITFVHSQFS